MEIVMVFMLVALAICSFLYLLKWNEIRYLKKGLPPGTMGWPFFGETTEFLKQGPQFMKKQRARYGNVFKTHFLGCPTIISMDPELNRFIFLNESKGLVPGYPQSALDILGKNNIAAVHGSSHKHIRGSLLSLISPPILKDKLLSKTDNFIRLFLHNWDGKTIDIQQMTKEMAFFIVYNLVLENESDSCYGTLKSELEKLLEGSLSLPIKFPGTSYYQGLKARENIIKILKEIIEKRRATTMTYDDILDSILKCEDLKLKLNDEELYDQILTLWHAGGETVSTTTMMAIKYLHDHPNALKEMRDEHKAIQEKKTPEEAIDWGDYRSMKFTRAVILETLRLATIINGSLRKTTKELTLNGHVFPEGWRIYLYAREINYDPLIFPEPFTFNPWRWLDNNLENHPHVLQFGGGSRLCPGKDLGITQISLFLHYFVTRYRWEEIGEQKIVSFPRVKAPNGLHIRVTNY